MKLRYVLYVLLLGVGVCYAGSATGKEAKMMTARFDVAFRETMRHEVGGQWETGGLVDDARDPGGLTQWGLSKRANPDLPIGKMSYGQAMNVYHERYWSPARLDQVHNLAVAMEIFDTGVNMGVAGAVKLAQEGVNLLNRMYDRPQIAVDGRVGPATLGQLNYWGVKDPIALLGILNGLQFREYIEIIVRNPKMIYALRAWARRCVPAHLAKAA